MEDSRIEGVCWNVSLAAGEHAAQKAAVAERLQSSTPLSPVMLQSAWWPDG